MTDTTTAPAEDTTGRHAAADESATTLPEAPEPTANDVLEVAQRSADGSDGENYVKIFRVLRDALDGAEHEVSVIEHQRNTDGVLREALNRGLHALAEVEYLGATVVSKVRRGMETVELAYSVKVTPAHSDNTPPITVVPANNPTKPAPVVADTGEVSKNPDSQAPAVPADVSDADEAAPVTETTPAEPVEATPTVQVPDELIQAAADEADTTPEAVGSAATTPAPEPFVAPAAPADNA